MPQNDGEKNGKEKTRSGEEIFTKSRREDEEGVQRIWRRQIAFRIKEGADCEVAEAGVCNCHIGGQEAWSEGRRSVEEIEEMTQNN